MLRTGERETEILLGNKQLLGIFFVVAILLGMAFTGGYMVGRSSVDKKGSADSSTATAQGNSAAETHAVLPGPPPSDGSNPPTTADPPQKPTSGGARPSSE